MRIGPHELSSNLFLSPLAGYTNLPMRLTVRELGGLGWATTDLVNARSLLERNRVALQLVASSPEDRPLAIQLFGSVPEEMRDAAVMCQELGAQSVDINMGCPVKKVVNIGGGSAMMTELDKTAAPRCVSGGTTIISPRPTSPACSRTWASPPFSSTVARARRVFPAPSISPAFAASCRP